MIHRLTGLAPEIPEDLYFLIKKAVAVRKHLSTNRKDKDSKLYVFHHRKYNIVMRFFHMSLTDHCSFRISRLILIESRIHRLSRYYKTVGVLPPTWRYESATASTLVA